MASGLTNRLDPAVGALRTALAEPAIRRLIVAWAASNAGQYAVLVINLVVAYDLGGAVGLGIFGIARYLAPAILAPFVGLPAGRWPAEAVLRGTNALRTIAVVGLIAVVLTDAPLWLMMLLVAVEASAGAFTRPLHMALLPAVAQTPAQLIGANVTSGAAEGLGTFVGPALASVLLVTTGPAGALAAVVVDRPHQRGQHRPACTSRPSGGARVAATRAPRWRTFRRGHARWRRCRTSASSSRHSACRRSSAAC